MADFKKRKAVLRKRRRSSDSSDSDGETVENKLEDIRALQKLREKQNGVSAASLALGKKIDKTEEITDADPFKMKTGGFIDMKALKRMPLTGEVAEAIGTSFAAETNRRDEDAEMLKYVEEEVAKRKGHTKEEEKRRNSAGQKQEDLLFSLPDHLKVSTSTKRTEDMLSNSMLSGIPEIDLGIEAKIVNIEATEEAKQKLLWERMNKKEEVSAFVPTNMAVNYMQHNRFKIEDHRPRAVKAEAPKPVPLRVGDGDREDTPNDFKPKKPIQNEKATDDFHYEKFKKQMRRF